MKLGVRNKVMHVHGLASLRHFQLSISITLRVRDSLLFRAEREENFHLKHSKTTDLCLLAVHVYHQVVIHLGSLECTQFKKLELLSAAQWRRATLTIPSCSPDFPRAKFKCVSSEKVFL